MDPNTPISEIMSKNIISLRSDNTLRELNELFDKHRIHHVLVLESGHLNGIVSKADVLAFYEEMNAENLLVDLDDALIEELMTPDPLTLDADDTLGLAADIILANRFHSIPIMEDGELVGVITNHDLIKFAFNI
jgi:acetoin utilization protein AcuB